MFIIGRWFFIAYAWFIHADGIGVPVSSNRLFWWKAKRLLLFLCPFPKKKKTSKILS